MLKVKAFGIQKESNQLYPEQNFARIVPKVLENENPDAIVLQTGSIEITNLDVKKAMMDTDRDIDSYRKEWAAKVENDSKNLFDVAENAVKVNPELRVIIVKRLPRFDSLASDPLGIKTELSKFANKTYDQIWFRRGGPKNVHVVNFDFDCERSSYLKEILFGNPDSRNYDGIHLRGHGASRHFTYRAVQAILPVFSPRQVEATSNDQPDFHANCPQTNYQRQSQSSSSRGNTEKQQFIFPRRVKKQTHKSNRVSNENNFKGGSNYYSIPVQNRYSENF